MKKGTKIALYNPKTLQKLLASKQAQAYTMAFLSFFALSFFTVFAIRPTLISFYNLQKQIQDARELNKKLDEKINMLLQAQKTYQDNQANIILLDKTIPQNPQLAQIIEKIEEIVIENEATISAFSTSGDITLLATKLPVKQKRVTIEPEKKPTSNPSPVPSIPVETVQFSLSTKGDYKKSELITSTMLNLKRLLSFSLLTFTPNENKDENDDFPILSNINAKAYYISKEKNL